MRKNSFIITLLFLVLSFSAAAQNFDYSAFSRIPIAHEGRIKPLSRYAELLFKDVTGEYPNSDAQASAWLSALLFDPTGAERTPQFHINDAQVIYVLGLPQAAEYYSFEEINDAFLKNKILLRELQTTEQPTRSEQNLLDLYSHATAFEQTKNALTAILPLRISKKDEPPKTFGDLPKNSFLYKFLSAQGTDNVLFRVIPGKKDWLSPWQAQKQGRTELLELWKKSARAYIDQNESEWSKQTEALLSATLIKSGNSSLDRRVGIERFYHQINPFFYSFLFYLFGFFASFISTRKKTSLLAHGFLGTGLVLHGLGLAARMIILQRPPVSTLYESVLFVGLVTTALFLLFAYRQKRESFLSLAGLAGISFYLIAFSLNDGQDDLKVLEAVLNTKFWLATHVMAITMGYALCALTALMAHAFIAAKSFKQKSFLATQEFASRIYQLSVWALLFVAGGTLLGGVWADQSWGRFWGWDPKENGALLIVLWLTWLLHARLSKRINASLFIFGMAFLSIIVGLSWLGVNLLGVGLHSYGFTSGLAAGFAAFSILDILFLFFLWTKGRHNGTFAATI